MSESPSNEDDRWKHVYKDPAFARRYAEKRASGASTRKREAAELALVAKAVGRAGLTSGARVLDCPAGTGRFARWLLDGGHRVVAADIAAAMLLESDPRPPSLVADALHLPFRDRTFELVLCVRLLHHVPGRDGREALLRELARVSSRWVIVSFFHAVSWHEARDRFMGWVRPFEKTRHAITLGTLRRDAGAASLVVRETFPLFRYVKRQWFVLLERV